MIKRAKFFLLIAFVLIASGCVPNIPPINFSPPNVGLSGQRINAEVKTLLVTLARPDEQVGEISTGMIETSGMGPGTGNVITSVWQTSLQEALDRMLVFKDDAHKKLSIHVKVLELYMPAAGASFTTKSTARYEIIDRNNGDIVFTQDIQAEGTCPADYAFAGVIRARESVNRSVQNNITLFLQSLETLDINKPMFPAKG